MILEDAKILHESLKQIDMKTNLKANPRRIRC